MPNWGILVYNHPSMDERPFYRRPRFYISLWLLLGVGFYLWQIRGMGGLLPNLQSVFFDVLLFFLGLLVWLAFFAQFVLPVRTFRERQYIFDRLITYLFGGHGPAIFIRDGKLVERLGEKKKKGPGVLWLDSASAAVTRNATTFKKTIGPGVHFTEDKEYLAGTVDLHLQNQGLGPKDGEDPFKEQGDGQGESEYKNVQNHRLEVAAWTRDGIEVVPNISVTFQIDAEPAKDGEAGSRFGFDPESVRKAITGEGVNPNSEDAQRRHVAWNQLPALVAADLWREYLSKFTLAELFETSPGIASVTPPAPPPAPENTRALLEPVSAGSGFELSLSSMIHELNGMLASLGDRCERSESKTVQRVLPASKPDKGPGTEEQKPETALQLINRMIKARMTSSKVIFLDDSGKPGEEYVTSTEYDLLNKRGIKVTSASVNNLRFPPNVEDQLVRQWSSTWLESAKAEHERIDRLRGFEVLKGQAEAVQQYSQSLSSNLLRHRPTTQKDTLKVLMLRSRDELVKNDQKHRRASLEREELEELIQWVERGGR